MFLKQRMGILGFFATKFYFCIFFHHSRRHRTRTTKSVGYNNVVEITTPNYLHYPVSMILLRLPVFVSLDLSGFFIYTVEISTYKSVPRQLKNTSQFHIV